MVAYTHHYLREFELTLGSKARSRLSLSVMAEIARDLGLTLVDTD